MKVKQCMIIQKMIRSKSQSMIKTVNSKTDNIENPQTEANIFEGIQPIELMTKLGKIQINQHSMIIDYWRLDCFVNKVELTNTALSIFDCSNKSQFYRIGQIPQQLCNLYCYCLKIVEVFKKHCHRTQILLQFCSGGSVVKLMINCRFSCTVRKYVRKSEKYAEMCCNCPQQMARMKPRLIELCGEEIASKIMSVYSSFWFNNVGDL